jgi:hypothetical protein
MSGRRSAALYASMFGVDFDVVRAAERPKHQPHVNDDYQPESPLCRCAWPQNFGHRTDGGKTLVNYDTDGWRRS